eukprot:1324851-Pyramimonas_sp.AAC.2
MLLGNYSRPLWAGSMVGWLGDLLVGWLAAWLVGWLVGWAFAGWLAGWLARRRRVAGGWDLRERATPAWEGLNTVGGASGVLPRRPRRTGRAAGGAAAAEEGPWNPSEAPQADRPGGWEARHDPPLAGRVSGPRRG